MKIGVKLSNKGYLLPGSGERSALIDADPVVTPDGFPYFPARTFKGLFKESCREVMEINGWSEDEINEKIEELFGKPGNPTLAKLRFHNLHLPNWSELRQRLPAYRAHNELAFAPLQVTAHFSAEIPQTALSRDGVIKDRTLRNFRAIAPGKEFLGDIEYSGDWDEELKGLLEKAACQLRFAGTKRNRGFGEVRVELDFNKKEDPAVADVKPHEAPEGLRAIRIYITTRSAAILSSLGGDPNTVSTDHFVRGSRVRGLIAEKLIGTKGLGKDAHLNRLFHQTVLSGELRFGPLYGEGGSPIPLNLHRIKAHPKDPLIDIFRPDGKSPLSTRTVGGLGAITTVREEDGKEMTKHVYLKFKSALSARFHNSRLNRSAGRNMENDVEGGIFYYEGLDPGQTFSGLITGDEKTLKQLLGQLPSSWCASIGKSKSTQYGDIEVRIEPERELPPVPDFSQVEQVLLCFQSPVIVHNEEGYAVPEEKVLVRYLEKDGRTAEILKAATSVVQAEGWNTQWQSRTGRIPAFGEGSAFLITKGEMDAGPWNAKLTELVREGLGEMREQGFGWVEVWDYREFPREIGQVEEKEANNVKNTQAQSPLPHESDRVGLLDEILHAFERRGLEDKVRLYAVERRFRSIHRIPNSLLSRLEQKLDDLAYPQEMTTGKVADFRKWLEELKTRPAGDTLKKKKLYEWLHDFYWILPSGGEPGDHQRSDRAQLAYLGWKAFFRKIRNNNKESKKSNGNTKGQ